MSNNSEILYLFGKASLCIVVTRYTIQFIIKSIFHPLKPLTDSEREQIRLSVENDSRAREAQIRAKVQSELDDFNYKVNNDLIRFDF
jgi:hypothetical protein